MSTLTHFKKQRHPNYIGSYELTVDVDTFVEKVVTIQKVVTEQVQNGDQKEMCQVVYFNECKPMILNTTNAKSIVKIADSPFIEHWVGKQICLYVAKVKAFGSVHDALRVKAANQVKVLPELVLGSDNFNKVKEAIANGYTLDQIKAKYTLSKEVEDALV